MEISAIPPVGCGAKFSPAWWYLQKREREKHVSVSERERGWIAAVGLLV